MMPPSPPEGFEARYDARPMSPAQRQGQAGIKMHLGKHHFSHLRSIAEGLDLQASALRYLGIDHGHQAKVVHRQTVDAVRAVARRHNEAAWRLIGLSILIPPANTSTPTLAEFISERDLDGWSEFEISEMYAEAYPPTPSFTKTERRFKLRERQQALLKRMESLAAEAPSPVDPVSGWFDDLTAKKLLTAGMLTLGDLRQKIAVGGNWFSGLPGIGPAKAERIAAFLRKLLGHLPPPSRAVFTLVTSDNHPSPRLPEVSSPDQDIALPNPLTYQPSPPLLAAKNDPEAVDAWIAARAGSKLTVKAYKREATRLMLWLQREARGKTFREMTINDCGDYMAFLQCIPAEWISRARAKPGTPGWAPFRGPLDHKSHRQAITIVASLFSWLQAAQYLRANPWMLVNRKTGDNKKNSPLDTKALSETAVMEVLRFVERQKPSSSRSRMRFIVLFLESVGLRSAELLAATLADLRLEPEGWVMKVLGKGEKERFVAIPGQAFAALQEYLGSRGLGGVETAPPGTPLLASTLDPNKPVGYQALYEHVKCWLSKAVSNSSLSSHERSKLAGASTHWLRHTFGTRAVARGVPLDVIQEQMGHASTQTVTSNYGRAPIKRRSDELGKAFT